MKKLIPLIASLTLAASLTAGAKTIKFPENDPAFSFALPDDWKTSVDKDGNLDCESGDGAKYGFSIIDTAGMPDMKTEAQVKAYLPELAKTMGDGAKIADLKIGTMQEMTTAKKLKLFGLESRGTAGGADMVISLGSFAADEGHYFILMGVSTAEQDQANGRLMNAFFDSITPEDDD